MLFRKAQVKCQSPLCGGTGGIQGIVEIHSHNRRLTEGVAEDPLGNLKALELERKRQKEVYFSRLSGGSIQPLHPLFLLVGVGSQVPEQVLFQVRPSQDIWLSMIFHP